MARTTRSLKSGTEREVHLVLKARVVPGGQQPGTVGAGAAKVRHPAFLVLGKVAAELVDEEVRDADMVRIRAEAEI